MNMKAIIAAAALVALAPAAYANCVGSDSFYTCYDTGSGNSYTVNRFGNTTMMTGNNTRTGSMWSETTNRFGNNAYTSGQASNGNSWSRTTTPYGTFGTDSRGNAFSNFGFGN